jgi:hypothetical protein
MDDKTVQALCESALKEDPRTRVQVFNITAPGTVIVIGGNYFGGGGSYKAKQKQELPSSETEEQLIEDDDEAPFETVRREEVEATSENITEDVAEIDSLAARKLSGMQDELAHTFTEDFGQDLWAAKLAKAGISQQIVDAQGHDAVDAILKRAFPHWEEGISVSRRSGSSTNGKQYSSWGLPSNTNP